MWLILYLMFIIFGTGPVDKRLYDSSVASPYKLPWIAGVSRFVIQGNRSFTRNISSGGQGRGAVAEIIESFDGIGFHSNYIIIAHEDGTPAMYAHIKMNGSVVKLGNSASGLNI